MVTGAARGIGAAAARALAARGAGVVLLDVAEAPLRALAAELGPRVVGAETVDVGSSVDVERVASALRGRGAGVDVLINNAGVYAHGALLDVADVDFAWSMGVNVGGVVRCCRAFVPLMAGRAGAQVVNVLSEFGVLPMPGKGAYCAAKAAGFMASAVLRSELRARGVTVTEFVPPAVATGLLASARTTDRRALEREGRVLARHAVPVERVAAALVGAVERPRRRVACGCTARAVMAGMRVAPGLTAWAARKAVERMHGPEGE